MEDIAGKIEELLNDPNGMAKIQSMAESVFGNSGSKDNNLPVAKNESIPDIDTGTIMKVFNLLRSNNNSSGRANLLLALKPHLSSERQQKIDSAIKIMKIIEILPVLKEQGILDNLL